MAKGKKYRFRKSDTASAHENRKKIQRQLTLLADRAEVYDKDLSIILSVVSASIDNDIVSELSAMCQGFLANQIILNTQTGIPKEMIN